jgi:hypothetical protein
MGVGLPPPKCDEMPKQTTKKFTRQLLPYIPQFWTTISYSIDIGFLSWFSAMWRFHDLSQGAFTNASPTI